MGRNKAVSFRLPEKQMTQVECIRQMCEMLDLKGIMHCFEKIINDGIASNATHYDVVEKLKRVEMGYREENRINRWTQQARFICKRTIEEFDFTFQPTIDQRQIRELASCRFVEQGKNVIFLGPPGVGKTHLATSLGVEAINKGFDVRFLVFDYLVEQMEKKDPERKKRFLRTLVQANLLIIDDMDYYATDEPASVFLLQLLKKRDEIDASTIFTSNRAPGDWGKLFGDIRQSSTAMDRMIGKAEIININGDSYRVKDKMKKLQSIATVISNQPPYEHTVTQSS